MHKLFILLAVLVGPLLIGVLYLVPPGEETFYPRCSFHLVTGLHCPGCGATRCVHALLHGDIAQAAAYNLIFVLAVPFVAAWALWAGCNLLRRRPLPQIRYPIWTGRLLIVLFFAYWVLRNLPVAPFNLLAPHEL